MTILSAPMMNNAPILNVKSQVMNSMRYILWLCFCALFMHSATAAMAFPDRPMLIKLFRSGDFTKLNNTLEHYQQAFQRDAVDERLLLYAIESISTANPHSAELLNQWIRLQPDKYIPYLARAYYYYHTARLWRGHETINGALPPRRAAMYRQLKMAADDLKQAITIEPSLTIAYALAIRILMLVGTDALRREAYEEAMAHFPHSYVIKASYLWSLKLKWGGRPHRLQAYMQEIESLVERNPLLADLLGYGDYIAAERLANARNYKQARAYYDSAIKKGADHILYRERGINYYHLGEYERALHDFNQSLALWPQDYRVLRWRANVYLRQGDYTKTITDLALAVELNPYDKYALLSLAAVLRKLGKFDGVLDLYDHALYYNSHDANIWFERGMHQARDLFMFDLAAADLQRATQLAPDEPQYWYHYAAALHYALDCRITQPLNSYLSLCNDTTVCNEKELAWARNAKAWLQQNHTCQKS